MIWLSCEILPDTDEVVLVSNRYRDYFFTSVETFEDGSRGWEDYRLERDKRHHYLWTKVAPPTDVDWL